MWIFYTPLEQSVYEKYTLCSRGVYYTHFAQGVYKKTIYYSYTFSQDYESQSHSPAPRLWLWLSRPARIAFARCTRYSMKATPHLSNILAWSRTSARYSASVSTRARCTIPCRAVRRQRRSNLCVVQSSTSARSLRWFDAHPRHC